MMSKFKVGDRVQVTADIDATGTVNAVKENTIQVYWDGQENGDSNVFWPDRGFSLIESNSPIRTVTRKEIVAGKYGAVDVAECKVENSAAVLIAMDWFGFDGKESGHAVLDADQLREAAHVLNQIAEALDE